jgi:hypothetical protein
MESLQIPVEHCSLPAELGLNWHVLDYLHGGCWNLDPTSIVFFV